MLNELLKAISEILPIMLGIISKVVIFLKHCKKLVWICYETFIYFINIKYIIYCYGIYYVSSMHAMFNASCAWQNSLQTWHDHFRGHNKKKGTKIFCNILHKNVCYKYKQAY